MKEGEMLEKDSTLVFKRETGPIFAVTPKKH